VYDAADEVVAIPIAVACCVFVIILLKVADALVPLFVLFALTLSFTLGTLLKFLYAAIKSRILLCVAVTLLAVSDAPAIFHHACTLTLPVVGLLISCVQPVVFVSEWFAPEEPIMSSKSPLCTPAGTPMELLAAVAVVPMPTKYTGRFRPVFGES
jgi:hypothetical protein